MAAGFWSVAATPVALEGEQSERRLVIIEFPSSEAARRFHGSTDYAPAIKLRQSLAHGRLTLLEEYLP